MNHQPNHQATPRNTSLVVLRQRLGFIALTLGGLLLVNALFFTPIAHATPTPTSQSPTATATRSPFITTPTPASFGYKRSGDSQSVAVRTDPHVTSWLLLCPFAILGIYAGIKRRAKI